MEDPDNASRCYIRISPKDPLAESVRLPNWTEPSSIRKPLRLGIWESHSTSEMAFWQEHALLAGATGSGKSGGVNSTFAGLLYCNDVVPAAIDLKGGMELGPWRDACWRFTTSPSEAVPLLMGVDRILDARMRELGRRGLQLWPASPQDPVLVIVVDEVARLDAEGLALLERIASQGRAVGVYLVIATQQPSAKVLDGTELRNNLTTRIVLRVLEAGAVDMVLGRGSSKLWRAHELAGKGRFMLRSDHHDVPEVGRFYWVDREKGDVDRVLRVTARWRPQLDRLSEEAAARADETPLPFDLPDPDDPLDSFVAVLRMAPNGGFGVPELVTKTGKSRATVYNWLGRLGSRVEQPETGRYRLARSEVLT